MKTIRFPRLYLESLEEELRLLTAKAFQEKSFSKEIAYIRKALWDEIKLIKDHYHVGTDENT